MNNIDPQNEIANARPHRGWFRRFSWKTGARILCVTLLAAGALGAVGLNQVMPKMPTRASGFFDRLAWYVSEGQMQADLRTFAHVAAYVGSSETTPPTATVPPNERLTQNAPPASPKS